MEFASLPYFMAHPGRYTTAGGAGSPSYLTLPAENDLMRDLDYLGQLYPMKVKKYQVKISSILDKLDYEGSMIYDEYPDRISLERLTRSIMAILEREEQKEEASSMDTQEPLIFVLLGIEIYKRRHGKKNRYLI